MPPAAPVRSRARAAPGLALLAAAALCGCAEEAAFPIEAPARVERDLDLVETTALAIEGALGPALAASLASSDPRPEDLCTADFEARWPAADAWRPVADAALELGVLDDGGAPSALAPRAFLERLRRDLPPAPARVAAEVQLYRLELAPALDRGAATVRLVLRAEAEDGARVEVRHDARARLVRTQAGWRFGALAHGRGERVAGRPRFVDVTRQVGFDLRETAEHRELFQRSLDEHRTLAWGGLSVVDWDRDGRPDLLATVDRQLATLFRNDGAGGFAPTPLPLRAPLECGAFALFLDLDGDGREELFSSAVLAIEDGRARMGLYTRRGEGWELLPDAFAFDVPRGRRSLDVTCVVPRDVDGDGDLDVFVGLYGDERSKGDAFYAVEAHDGARNLLFVNHGGLRFVEESRERGLVGTQYTFVALFHDLDGDGDEDLLEANDFGPNRLWANDGEGRFEPVPEGPFAGVSGFSMGLSLADYEGDGRTAIYLANMSSRAGARVVPLARDVSEAMRARLEVLRTGNMLYVQDAPGAPWRERAVELGVNEGLWSWASLFVDLDGDGDQELYSTNGFCSHRDPALPDWDSLWWRQIVADACSMERGEPGRFRPEGLGFAGSFDGHQPDRLFHNPDGASERFFEAAWVLGLARTWDGRAAAPVDVDGDGDLDLALWTLQGLALLENRAPPRAFARVELAATEGPACALGARVELRAGGRTQTQLVRCIDGFQTQVPLALHFGLGDAERVDGVRVTWPSGRDQEWGALPAGRRLLLTEGAPEARIEELPRWPDATRPRPDARPALDALGEAGRPPAGGATLVRFETGASGAGPELGERARVLRVAAGEAPDSVRAAFFGAGPACAASFLFDADGALARAWYRAVDEGEVRAVLDELGAEPDFPDLQIAQGERALRNGRPAAARSAFERACAADPRSALALQGVGRARVAEGALLPAEEAFAAAVALDPGFGLGWHDLAVTRARLGRPAQALAAFERALELRGPSRATLLPLGEAAAEAGRLERARAAFRAATELDPDDAEAFTLLGKAEAGLGDRAAARAALERALALDPDAADARRALAGLERAGG